MPWQKKKTCSDAGSRESDGADSVKAAAEEFPVLNRSGFFGFFKDEGSIVVPFFVVFRIL